MGRLIALGIGKSYQVEEAALIVWSKKKEARRDGAPGGEEKKPVAAGEGEESHPTMLPSVT